MKPVSALTFLIFIGLLFTTGAFWLAADRAVQAEYAYREQSESVIATRITQYQSAREGQKASAFTGGGMLTAVLAFTMLFTAVSGFMGKDGLTGVLRQLHRMMPKRSRPRPTAPPVNASVNTAAPLALPEYNPRREEVNTAVASNPTREGGSDAIQWI